MRSSRNILLDRQAVVFLRFEAFDVAHWCVMPVTPGFLKIKADAPAKAGKLIEWKKCESGKKKR